MSATAAPTVGTYVRGYAMYRICDRHGETVYESADKSQAAWVAGRLGGHVEEVFHPTHIGAP